MQKITSLLLLIFIASCSKPNSGKNSVALMTDESNTIDFGELNVSVPSTGIPAAPQALDFASLDFKQSGFQDLIITNSSSSSDLVYSAEDFDSSVSSPFVVSNGCVGTIGPRKKCSIKFTLSNPTSLVTEQNLTSLFKIKDVDISLTGILAADDTDYSAPLASVSVAPFSLNFGSFKVGESKELSVVVKNNGLVAVPGELTAISNSNVTMTSTCTNPLAPRRPCVVKLKYTGVSSETKADENLLKVANYQITHSVIVTSPSVLEPEILNIQPAQPSVAVAVSQPESQAGTIRFTNTGTVGLSAPVSAVSSDDGIVITSISCTGGLQRSKSCDVNYSLNSPNLPSGVSAQTIKLQSGTIASEVFTLNLNIVPNSVACSVADAQANGVSVLNSNSSISGMKTGADISQCLLASNACNQYYSIANDSKSCSAATSSCLPADAQANGWNINQALAISGSRLGSDITACAVSSCNAEYLLNVGGKTCDGVLCTLVNAQGNGVSSILNVATVSGSINDDSCLVTTCDQYYKNALDNKSCSPKLCNELNSGELSSLGYNLTGATISGTYNSCTVTCNSSFQQVAVDGKSCEDKTPSGAISFAADYTKILTPNVVNITSTNAQSIQFYSDVGCTATAGTAIALPLASTNLTLSPGDGTKTAYAKFINGSLSSTCMSDTIILDQTLPALAVTTPVLDANIAENSLVVSGTCSEINPATITVEISINGVTQNSNCANGIFSSTFDISSISVGSNSINILSTDLAGNLGSNSSTFNKINCTVFQTLDNGSCVDKIPSGTFSVSSYNQNDVSISNIMGINSKNVQLFLNTTCNGTAAAQIDNNTTSLNYNFGGNSLDISSLIDSENLKISLSFQNGLAKTCVESNSFVKDNVAPSVSVLVEDQQTIRDNQGTTFVIQGLDSTSLLSSNLEIMVGTLLIEDEIYYQNYSVSSVEMLLSNFDKEFYRREVGPIMDGIFIPNIDYFYTVKLTDLSGNTVTSKSSAFRYSDLFGGQTIFFTANSSVVGQSLFFYNIGEDSLFNLPVPETNTVTASGNGGLTILNNKLLYRGTKQTPAVYSLVESDLSQPINSENANILIPAQYTGGSTKILQTNNKYYYLGGFTNMSDLQEFNPSLPASSTNPKLIQTKTGNNSGPRGGFVLVNGKIIYNVNSDDTVCSFCLHVYDPTQPAVLGTNPFSIKYSNQYYAARTAVSELGVVGNKVYYTNDWTSAPETALMSYDSSAPISATNPKKEASVAISGSSSQKFVVAVGNKVYFDSMHGSPSTQMQLWVFDTSLAASGTNPKIVDQTTVNPWIESLGQYNGKFYYRKATSGGYEMWEHTPETPISGTNPKKIFDGTVTNLVTGYSPTKVIFSNSAVPQKTYEYNPTLPISATNPKVLIDSMSASGPVYYGNKMYYTGTLPKYGAEIFEFDFTQPESSTNPKITYDYNTNKVFTRLTTDAIAFDNNIYFNATDDYYGYNLWKLKLTEALSPTNPAPVFDMLNPGDVNMWNFNVFNNKVYFTAMLGSVGLGDITVYDPALPDSATNPLLTYDTALNYHYLAQLNSVRNYVMHNNKIYYPGVSTTSGMELWVYDPALPGSATNPKIVYDTLAGTGNGCSGFLTLMNNKIYYNGAKTASNNELFVYDPSVAASATNPNIVYELHATSGSTPQGFITYGGKLYFIATPSTTIGTELVIYDPSLAASATNPKVLFDRAGINGAVGFRNAVVNGKLYFTGAETSATGGELMMYDPALAASATNPKLISDINPGTASSNFLVMKSAYGKLFFVATNGVNGNELYMFDPSVASSATNPKLIEVNPGGDSGIIDIDSLE